MPSSAYPLIPGICSNISCVPIGFTSFIVCISITVAAPGNFWYGALASLIISKRLIAIGCISSTASTL